MRLVEGLFRICYPSIEYLNLQKNNFDFFNSMQERESQVDYFFRERPSENACPTFSPST